MTMMTTTTITSAATTTTAITTTTTNTFILQYIYTVCSQTPHPISMGK